MQAIGVEGSGVEGNGVEDIDEDDFRALARSSPWLWRTLEIIWDGDARVWLERPDREVVLHSGVLHAQESPRGSGISGAEVVRPDGRVEQASADDYFHVSEVEPRRRADGLVVSRPDGALVREADLPQVRGYFSAAAMDPAELAEHTAVTGVRATRWRGRPTWVATVRPLEGYQPRCTCCALLPHAALAAQQWGQEEVARMAFPDSVEVWLDRQTGVMTRWLPSGGHDPVEVEIVAVDADISPVWQAAKRMRPDPLRGAGPSRR